MDDFIRPEVRAALWRWREVAVATAISGLGLWWGVTTPGILRWLGFVIAALSGVAAFAAFQRLRFAPGGGGQGVVEIDERRLAYYGPLSGGVIDLDDLARLDLDPSARPVHWVLTPVTGEPLMIPVDAEGAEQLFDAFTGLPGLAAERLVAALATSQASETDQPVRLWTRPNERLT